MPLSTTQLVVAQRWQQLAGRTRARINLAWWWQGAAPLLAGIAGLACAVVLYLRSTLPVFNIGIAASAIGGTLLLAVCGAWLWARRKFVSTDEGLVQLDDHLRLKNALTSAAVGVGNWPELPVQEAPISDGLRWKWTSIWPPTLVIVGSLAMAMFWPVAPPEVAEAQAIAPPSATQETERMLQALEQSDAARQEDIEQFKKALTSLQKQAPEKWYSHSSLEAADHLQDSLARAASDLNQNLQKAGSSLEKLGADGGGNQAGREQTAQDLKSALEGLKNGGLQPNEELLKKLKALDPAQLQKQMTKEQLEELKEAMKQNQKALQEALNGKGKGEKGEGMSDEEKALREALKNGAPGDEEGEEKGMEGEGEPQRGPGTVDLKMRRKETDLGTNNPEKEQTHDLKRLTPGELLGTSDGEHEVDKTVDGTITSEGTAATGAGGDAVRKESLLPEEKRVLRKYFK
jgi:hypothetical protein